MLGVFAAMMVLMVVPAFAQTSTPIPPTATLVAIVVPTNQIFTQTNSWITVFTPLVAIGIGIAIALTILTFVGNQILKAFRGGGR